MNKLAKLIFNIIYFFSILIFKIIAIILYVPIVIVKSLVLIMGTWVTRAGYILAGIFTLLLIVNWNEFGTGSTAIINRVLFLLLIFITGGLPILITTYGTIGLQFILEYFKILIIEVPFILNMDKSYNKYFNDIYKKYNRFGNDSVTADYKETFSENDWMQIQTKKRAFAFDSVLERDTYDMLLQEVGSNARIDFHVHLNEIFELTSNDDTYLNKMWVCHIDFIIRDKYNLMNILFALEVDGADAHRIDIRTMINDSFKNKLFNENEILLIRVGGTDNSDYAPFHPETYPTRLSNALAMLKQ